MENNYAVGPILLSIRMDRSYPYSRRLMARARLRKRLAAVSAGAIAAAAAGFMLVWTPDPIASTLPPAASSRGLLATLASDAGGPTRGGVRRIYPYSVIPGGVSGATELARAVRTDSVVAEHYATFDVARAHPVTVERPRAVHVSYRKGGKVYWTARKVMLAPGETLLTDGRHEMRARCANRISDVPQYPVEAHQPAMDELDNPVEVGEDSGYALGPDGLPLSSAGAGATPRHTGQAGRVAGGGFGATGSGGAAGAASGDSSVAGSAPGMGNAGVQTMGQSRLSGNLGSRARSAGTPAATTSGGGANDTAGGSDGGSGSSASAQPPATGSADPAPAAVGSTPVPGTGASIPGAPPGASTTSTTPAPPTTPALPPQPDTTAELPPSPAPQPAVPIIPGTPLPSTPLPSTPLPSTPLPESLPEPLPAPLPPGTPGSKEPTPPQPGTDTPLFPLPRPAPLPLPGGADIPPVLQPGPVITPDVKETPTWAPPPGSLPGTPSIPGLDPEPFIPTPDLTPPPLQAGSGPEVEPGAPPATVPEPGSLWLAAIALAALCGLRRPA